ncbi:helix-turn-helix domain-containing protein [Amycolatopsis sp. CA-230715]|uniref:helix-turn-helix domain-containing protein n=1 Tax=Amycolatopsis sp. CA-230715 TaxID=2745196 RepID=UPI001C02295C|nr:helix-turn-helix domain-containing protein [Amycolatopsis sp. CA-230715]
MTGEWVVARPHQALRPLVERYIGYTQHGLPAGVHRGLPSRFATLVISLDEPMRVLGMPLPGENPIAARGMVGGMHTGPALLEQTPFQSGIHLELNPLATHALLGVSAAELSGQLVGLGALGSPALAELPDRLTEARTWRRRFEILDQTLGDCFGDGAAVTPEIGWAWRRMRAAAGRVRVDALADEVGWSRRHFGELFRRELGLPPKQAARVLRFERAGAVLRASGRVDLAALAADCGYYDQAHLTREWRALAGCTPGVWIAEELPFLQYTEPEAETDSVA